GLTIAVLAGVGALLTISHSNSAAQEQRLVVSNFETISLMHQALIVLDNSEIGERSYLLTGNVAELRPYEQGRLRIDGVLRQLEASAADDPDAQRQIADFRAAAEHKLDELGAAIQAYQLYGRDAALPPESVRLTTDRLQRVAQSYIENQR